MTIEKRQTIKQRLRREITTARRLQQDKDHLSERVRETLWQLTEFATAKRPLIYVDVRDEVRTRPLLAQLLTRHGSVVLPFCVERELQLGEIRVEAELVPGAFGILEPAISVCDDPMRLVEPADVDVILVPGVAFDRQGGRLGHGYGYYDRLLARTSSSTPRIALAYDCQIVERVPRERHDLTVHKIVTPTEVITAL